MKNKMILLALFFATDVLSQPCEMTIIDVKPERILAGDTVNLLVFNFTDGCEQPMRFFFKINGPSNAQSYPLLFIGQPGNPSQSQLYRFDIQQNDTLKAAFNIPASYDSSYSLLYGSDTNNMKNIAFVVFPNDPVKILICNDSIIPAGDTLFMDSSSGTALYLSAFDKYGNLIGHELCTWSGFGITDPISNSSQVYIEPKTGEGWLYAEFDSMTRDSIYIRVIDNMSVLPTHKRRYYTNGPDAVYDLLGRTFKEHKNLSLGVSERKSRLMPAGKMSGAF